MAEWKYLWSEVFRTRYAIAAWLLRDIPYIIEIGGYKTPISDFLRPDQKSVVIDPRTPSFKNHQTEHIAASFDATTQIILPNSSYGMTLLGLDLGMSNMGWENLFSLINGAKRTIIEIPVEHPTSITQFLKIKAKTNTHITLTMSIDFSKNHLPDMEGSSPPHFKRDIYVLES
jgi:hypothetical protein